MQHTKKILITLLFATTMFSAKAQVVFEHSYRGVEIINIGSDYKYIVDVFDTGYRYFNLYNLDHSLYKKVYYPKQWKGHVDSNSFGLQHVSNSIIDCDTSNVEYIVRYVKGNNIKTRIYGEKGNLIFNVDSFGGGNGFAKYGKSQYIVENTSKHSIMKLSNEKGDDRIYSFCGKYTSIPSPPLRHNDPDDGGTYNNYPNPTTNETRIDYTLPAGVSNATIVLFNAEGKEVNRYRVDNTFDNLIINTQNLAAGVYNYSLISKGRTEPAGKIVVVK